MNKTYKWWASNLFECIAAIYLIALAFYLIYSITPFREVYIISIFILSEYMITFFWLNLFLFYDDEIMIFYPTRILNRKQIIKYDSIKLVRYINKNSKASSPTISIEFDIRDKYPIPLPSHSFTVYSDLKRRRILKHFHNKGIIVRIESNVERDCDILN